MNKRLDGGRLRNGFAYTALVACNSLQRSYDFTELGNRSSPGI
jgi:hypothetical protein